MRLLTHAPSDAPPRAAILDDHELLHDLCRGSNLLSLLDVIDCWGDHQELVKRALEEVGLPLTATRVLAPIPRPRRNIFCVGKNYREHAREFATSGYDVDTSTTTDDHAPSHPIVFTKPPSSVIGPGAVVSTHPTVTKEVDYEGELAVIVGRGGINISADDAGKHIWGYTILNDVTARDRQRDHKQWFLGKGLDTFCPMGPYAVSADEVDPDGQGRPHLRIESAINGEVRQRAATSDLIFDVPRLIQEISAGLTLEPGDIIATGTPDGVGIGYDPPRFLKAGDEMTVSITGLGILRNQMG